MDVTESIPATLNFERLLSLPPEAEIIVLEGSTRSSKTISVVQFLVLRCQMKPGHVVRCFRKDGTTHKDSTIPDLKFVMAQFGEFYGDKKYFDTEGKWNKTDKTYTFNNGSTFSFHETKDILKLHGMPCDDAWLNEAMEICEDAWKQIGLRCRKLKILDFNPSFNHHWVFTKVLTRPGVAHFHSTYKDNPFLTPAQVREIEQYDPLVLANVKAGTSDQWHWDVYGLGKRGKVEGAIYKLWSTVTDWPEVHNCQKWGYGLDFGFHPDPAALIECALFQDGLYLREHCYKENLIITKNITRPGEPSIQHEFEAMNMSKEAKIYADCAQPGSIRDLSLCGYNVVPCTKGPDSVLHGITLCQRYKLYVHHQSMNLQTELEHYRWKQKNDGTWLRDPEDKWNHLLDPMRYWASAEVAHYRPGIKPRKAAQAKSRIRRGGRY